MTRLLVSVRNPAEAAAAVAAGADLIDVKEPARGSLGAADAATIAEVLAAVDGRRPVSAAFGELCNWHASVTADVPAALGYAKLGLAGCARKRDWAALWQQCLSTLPPGVQTVAVVYADWRTAIAPEPAEILARACELGCAAVLVDTFDKAAGGLLDVWPLDEVERFARSVRSAGLLAVLGGGLTEATLAELLPLAPDYVAVRGAACSGGRESTLDPAKVRRLARLVHREKLAAIKR